MLFNIVLSNLDDAIHTLEKLEINNVNNSSSWAVAAGQLSAFHNIAICIKNKELKKCYCGKLHSYILRIANILEKVDDYKFFYGDKNYRNQSSDELLKKSYQNHTNISLNALGCVVQFMMLFHGTGGDYMFKDSE
jgi:hypothetical protein